MQNLIVRGNRYSFHIKIPKDVQRYFGGRIKFVKALKTDSLADAKFAADILRAKFTSSFTLLRAGLLSDEQMLQLQEELTGVKAACSRTTCLLSELFSQYMDESGDGWSVKTRHECERRDIRLKLLSCLCVPCCVRSHNIYGICHGRWSFIN